MSYRFQARAQLASYYCSFTDLIMIKFSLLFLHPCLLSSSTPLPSSFSTSLSSPPPTLSSPPSSPPLLSLLLLPPPPHSLLLLLHSSLLSLLLQPHSIHSFSLTTVSSSLGCVWAELFVSNDPGNTDHPPTLESMSFHGVQLPTITWCSSPLHNALRIT